MMATTIPYNVPSSTTPANATSAQMNPVRRILRISWNSWGLMSPSEYTITTAANVACGIMPRSGASSPVQLDESWCSLSTF